MSIETLLRAARPVHLLIPRPGQLAASVPKFWSIPLGGLHQDYIKASTKSLRDTRKRSGKPVSEDPSLKVSGLHHGLAQALGAASFDDWRLQESSLLEFLDACGMTQPADLIGWKRAPSRLTARQVSDRLFHSGLPLPAKIFTGVGSTLFHARGRGRIDIYTLADRCFGSDEAELEWCEAHAHQTVLALEREFDWDADAPDAIELTGRDLMLCAYRGDHLATAFNLLGDNLVAPMLRPPEFRLYGANADELAFVRKVFDIFRAEIERTDKGWVEVIPFPDNPNIIFLKGDNGAFDWVIRNQRDTSFTGNPYYPVLHSHELPTAMQVSELEAHLYFTSGEWYERLEHSAETRHYTEGGTAATWPGYSTLLKRELLATPHHFAPPSQPRGPVAENFIAHRLDDYCLMVSPLLTISEFWQFFEGSDWQKDRIGRTEFTSCPLEPDLGAVNLRDADHLPASVTWYDAVAYCRYVEDKTKLPVRLLEVEEWKKISPLPLQDIKKDGWGELNWAVMGGDGLTGGESRHRHTHTRDSNGFLRFGKELTWSQNPEGLPFLSVVDFGEWLADNANGNAQVANAATGLALRTGPLERDRCPAHLTMRYKGLKVGFRMCYVAKPDA